MRASQPQERPASSNTIKLRGVRVHNLKSVDVDIPRGQLIAICGVSGSGKTSLALDTLYAEGQRRYVESFSAYMRQFLERIEKPDYDSIQGLPPALAVTRGAPPRGNRSTVGTASETLDYLRLLFANVSDLFCHGCGRKIESQTPQSVARLIESLDNQRRLMVAFRTGWDDVGDRASVLAELQTSGFVRLVAGGRMLNLGHDQRKQLGDSLPAKGEVWVIVDRLRGGDSSTRTTESLENAFEHGLGEIGLLIEGDSNEMSPNEISFIGPLLNPYSIDDSPWSYVTLSTARKCSTCLIEYPDPEPQLFSFNSPLGACSECEGSGDVGVDTIIDEPSGRRYVPLAKRSVEAREDHHCASCDGARLSPASLSYRISGKNLAELCDMEIVQLSSFLSLLNLSERNRTIAAELLRQVLSRLGYLQSVGLGYLQLARPLRTLSGGEVQRTSLTTTLGSSLVNMLYVLDEPSVGLHPDDVTQLASAIDGLTQRGNTVVIVEHEEALLERAGTLIEVGPGAGTQGGEIVYCGPRNQIQDCESLTGDYLSGRRSVAIAQSRRDPVGSLRLTGCTGNNLKSLNVEFPLGLLCVVTGVSGSGKSSLVQDTLYGALVHRQNAGGSQAEPAHAGHVSRLRAASRRLPFDTITGTAQFNDCTMVDQSPVSRSPRSNPVTYVKAFDEIRRVFANTVDARTRNLSAGHFSFNSELGRCPRCNGDGVLEIDMQFLADVRMECPECRGTRYRSEILVVRYRDQTIADVLKMTVHDASQFFRGAGKVKQKLKALLDVGLDYLQLGQSSATLSSGESQRLKLAGHLAKATQHRTLFLMDEPTTGLHPHDIVRLLACFGALLDAGHSLIVVEHNVHLMAAADHIIDLGPGPADRGGNLVVAGTPEQVANCPKSVTGKYLKQRLS